MPTTTPFKREGPVSYKTYIKRTLVEALREAFSSAYKDTEFQNLHIYPHFPLRKIEYPAIYIDFIEGDVPNAGVGHVEYFEDPTGLLRKWMHRRFEGSIEFTIVTLSPLSRDVLSDGLVELLSMGTLETTLRDFFYKIYGDPTQSYSTLALYHQINLNTDVIHGGNDSAGLAPWEPEDQLVYQTTYTIDITGGFYNSIPTDAPLTTIQTVIQEPYAFGEAIPPSVEENNPWVYPFVWYDEDVVSSRARASARESTSFDSGTVIAVAHVAGLTINMSVDAGTVTSHGAYEMPIFHMWEDAPTIDLSTLPGHSKDVAEFHDRSTSTSIGRPSGIEAQHFLDAGMVTSIATLPLPDNPSLHFDSATIITQAIIDSGNVGNFVDGGTVTASGTTTSVENLAFIDANTVMAISVPVTVAETYNFGITYIENFTFVSRAVHSATDIEGGIDSNVATSVAVPLADEINIPFFEVTTLTSTAVPSANDIAAYMDSDTATGVIGNPAITNVANFVDQDTVTSVADLTRTSAGGFYVDADTVFSFAAPSASDSLAVTVAFTITSVAVPSAADSYNTIDTGTVTAVAVSSATSGDIFGPVDALSVISVGIPSTAEIMTFTDSATETSVGVVSGTDSPAIVDASVVTAVAVVSMAEIRGFVDLNTVASVAVPSGSDIGGFIQANTVTAVAAPSDSQSYGTTDSASTTSTAVVSGINTIDFAPDAASVQSFGTPSSTDQNIYAGDSGTVTSVGTIAPGTIVYVQDDFNRTTSGGWGTAPTGYTWVIDNPNSADFSTTTASGGTGLVVIPNAGGNAHYARQGGLNQLDLDVYLTISWSQTPAGNVQNAILVRVNPNSPTANFYRAGFRLDTDGNVYVFFESIVNNTTTSIGGADVAAFAYALNTQYMFRFRIQGTNPTNLYAYAGTPDTSDNPSWTKTYSENPSSITAAGDTSIRTIRNANNTNTNFTFTYYDFKATSIPGTASDIYTSGSNLYTDSATVTSVADTSSSSDIYTPAITYYFSDNFNRTVTGTGDWGTASDGHTYSTFSPSLVPTSNISVDGTRGKIKFPNLTASITQRNVAVTPSLSGVTSQYFEVYHELQWDTLPSSIGFYVYNLDISWPNIGGVGGGGINCSLRISSAPSNFVTVQFGNETPYQAFTYATTKTVGFKVRVESTIIGLKAWDLALSEPSSYQLTHAPTSGATVATFVDTSYGNQATGATTGQNPNMFADNLQIYSLSSHIL